MESFSIRYVPMCKWEDPHTIYGDLATAIEVSGKFITSYGCTALNSFAVVVPVYVDDCSIVI